MLIRLRRMHFSIDEVVTNDLIGPVSLCTGMLHVRGVNNTANPTLQKKTLLHCINAPGDYLRSFVSTFPITQLPTSL